MKKLKSNVIGYFSIALLFFSAISYAQPGFDDDVDDEPLASINTHLVLLITVAAGLGFYFLQTKKLERTSACK